MQNKKRPEASARVLLCLYMVLWAGMPLCIFRGHERVSSPSSLVGELICEGGVFGGFDVSDCCARMSVGQYIDLLIAKTMPSALPLACVWVLHDAI